jgi:flavodoxin/nitric oxide synthase
MMRYIHLTLAIIASLFFALVSVTGIIIGIDNIDRQYPSYKAAHLDQITLAQSIAGVKEVYQEVNTLSFDPRGFAAIKATDKKGTEVKAHIDPLTGKVLGKVEEKSSFVKFMTSLHRSLELKNVGRIIMGFIALCLVFSAISGLVLIFRKQNGAKNFFKKTIKDGFSRYYHTVFGKWLLIPLLILGLTGTYLVYNRFLGEKPKEKYEVDYSVEESYDGEDPMDVQQISIFNQITLDQVVSVEFPFDTTFEDAYLVKLKDRELVVSQFTGNVLNEIAYPQTQVFARFCKDLHTGRTSAWWAAVLVVACVGMLFFIYTGFAITFSRKSVKVRNTCTPAEAEYILLYGSEGGNTLSIAQKVFTQLQALGKKTYLAPLNSYQTYPKGTHLLIFTSTYGVGNPPSNADKFLSLLSTIPQGQLSYTVVGFGSKLYPDYCAFAIAIEEALKGQSWAKALLPLHTVNDQSVEEFLEWVAAWNTQTHLTLETTLSYYEAKRTTSAKIKVLVAAQETAPEETFSLVLHTKKRFTSGDLLAIYPDGKQERLYSIGKVGGKLQLTVKRHEHGLGSGYLYQLKQGETFQARIVPNSSFYFPKKAKKVVLVANGTGVAPFLGMADQNKQAEVYVYLGLRHNDATAAEYRRFFESQQQKGKIKNFQLIFSREASGGYVTDLLKKDAALLTEVLTSDGVVMICGSLDMYKDVTTFLSQLTPFSADYYKANQQLLVDCY